MRILPPVTRPLWLASLTLAATVGPAAAQEAAAVRRVQDALLPRIIVKGESLPPRSLAERMASHEVPAVSVAVLNGGAIEWARAWGMADVASGRPATVNTLFQAASISKPVAATAALSLVEDGLLDLDADVNGYLTSWQVPDTSAANGEPVTLRRLLTHTAGLTVHGFPGYARSARIPSAVEVLDGRGNTDPVRIFNPPGALWRYSGGGYTVAQVLLSDVTGTPFDVLLQERVLGPAGMTRSTYTSPLPESRWEEAATGYRSDGSPVEENWHVYPEQAAAGLWTTPSDLLRWGMAILAAYDGAEGGVLSPAMARQMLTPGLNSQGLGPAVARDGSYFGHGGSNEGFRCQLVVFFDGRGAAVMTNGDRGGALMAEVLGTLADVYGWPAFTPTVKTVATIDRSVYGALAGTYRIANRDIEIVVTLEDGRLFVAPGGQARQELLPEGELVFFTRDDGVRVAFVREGGAVVALEAQGLRAERVR